MDQGRQAEVFPLIEVHVATGEAEFAVGMGHRTAPSDRPAADAIDYFAGVAQMKFAASAVLPLPLYFACIG